MPGRLQPAEALSQAVELGLVPLVEFYDEENLERVLAAGSFTDRSQQP
ncbi:MAG: hypothetical protein U0894_01065 [Pirellulales bacterium]